MYHAPWNGSLFMENDNPSHCLEFSSEVIVHFKVIYYVMLEQDWKFKKWIYKYEISRK